MKKNPLDIPVDEFTSPASIFVAPESSAQEILDIFKRESIRHIPVVEANKPVGIISERNVLYFANLDNFDELSAMDIMTEEPFKVLLGTMIDEVALSMSEQKIGSALVVNPKGELEGIFTSTDGLNALIEIVRGDLP